MCVFVRRKVPREGQLDIMYYDDQIVQLFFFGGCWNNKQLLDTKEGEFNTGITLNSVFIMSEYQEWLSTTQEIVN